MMAAPRVTPAGQRILARHYPSDRLCMNQFDGTFRWDRYGEGESKRAVEKLIEAGLLTLHPIGTGGVTSLSKEGAAFVAKWVRDHSPRVTPSTSNDEASIKPASQPSTPNDE